jgi:hypothetical protein
MKTHPARYVAALAAVPALVLIGLGTGSAQAQPTDPPQTEETPANTAGMVQACQRHMDEMAPQMESMMESMDKMGDMRQPGAMGSMDSGGRGSMMGSA